MAFTPEFTDDEIRALLRHVLMLIKPDRPRDDLDRLVEEAIASRHANMEAS